MYQNDAMKVLTGEVRLSYANLTTPRAAQQGGEPKYSVTLLIPKSDAATKADIDAAIQAAANEALAKVWNGARPPMLKVPIYDGDGVRPSGVPFGDECKGHWVMTASTKNKPQVVGIDNINCELSPADIYSGMYAGTMLALLKVARIATGSSPDSFIDLAGYAACAGEIVTERSYPYEKAETQTQE